MNNEDNKESGSEIDKQLFLKFARCMNHKFRISTDECDCRIGRPALMLADYERMMYSLSQPSETDLGGEQGLALGELVRNSVRRGGAGELLSKSQSESKTVKHASRKGYCSFCNMQVVEPYVYFDKNNLPMHAGCRGELFIEERKRARRGLNDE